MLLSACSVVPVLAAENSPPRGDMGLPPEPEGFDPSKLPGAADITAGVEKAEDEEAERKAWLEGPEATRQREAARTAYSGLDAAAAEALLRSTFAKQLEQLNGDPARVLSDAQLIASTEANAATIRDEGHSELLESSVPVKAEDDEGNLRKVDVSLEPTAAGFETENALVDVRIPKSPGAPITVGAEGVAVKLGGADQDRIGRLFGDGNVFTPEVLPDTDMLVSPVATGVEIFNVLRSAGSPETFHYQVQVPPGAELRTAGEWGAEVARGNETLAVIPDPAAVDAQGTNVPVSLAVEGNSLVVTVEHRDADYAMPILLDPIVENDENWIYGQNHDALDLGVWGYWNAGSWWFYGSTKCIYECFGPGGAGTRGLYVSLEGQRSYGANQFGQWGYSAPAGSFISTVRMGPPYVHADHGCPDTEGYPQPHNYFGVWSGSGWTYLSVNSANQPGGSWTLPFSGESAVFGLSTGGGISFMPCWRDLYAGGASVWLDDNNWPKAVPVQNPPTTWIKNTTPVHMVSQASDAGLGIQRVLVLSEGAPEIPDSTANKCSGTRRSPCLTGYTATWDVTGASFNEGRRPAAVVAYDATGKASNAYNFETKVDGKAPSVTLNGQLAIATDEDEGEQKGAEEVETLRLPVYDLAIEAKDGAEGNTNQKTWQSGVKNIEIRLDGAAQEVPWSAQSCAPGHDCGMSKTYQLKLSKLQSAGKHKLVVLVSDFAGNVRERDVEFEYFPATGMKDEYVMQYFPLPDGSGNEAEEEHPKRPELAVNVMNGNLVYREADVDVRGTAGVRLEVERYYNSMLPTSENTEWGDGWTLAQTPELTPLKTGGSPTPNQAEIVDESGDVEGGVPLPTSAGSSTFDPELQATVTKTAGGGYELEDESGESSGPLVFDAGGDAVAQQGGGYSEVEYDREGGTLSQIEVSDSATFAADPSELEIPKPALVTQPEYASSFGSSGTGNGQMKAPADVAVDPQGNVWVVDKTNNRIEKFDAAGGYLLKVGSLGTGNGQFNRPTAIAAAANGDVLVTDAGNARVERFSSAGTYLSKFGTKGTANGQFAGNGPEGVGVDVAGNVWVADTYGGRLEKFSSAGAFLLSVGTKGSGTGQLGEPTGLDVAPSGDIWVADRLNTRISVFKAAGTFSFSFGETGTGNRQFKSPDEVEVDKLGNVWVGDQGNSRIQELDAEGQFKAKFGSAGAGQGQFSFASPMGIVADSKGRLWIADTNNNRIQQWTVPIERPAYISAFGASGTGDGKLSTPGDVAVGIEGNLWVVDKGNNRIQKFDQNGAFLAKVGSLGSGDGQFNRPTAVAVDRDGNLLVVDSGNNRVEKLDSQGQFVSKFGTAGSGNGQFASPEGIATDFEGNVWVADSGNGRIEKFDEEGKFLAVVGSKGAGSGQLSQPIGIDVDPNGNVWVADLKNNRVSIFQASGSFVGEFGSTGAGLGQFNRPSGLEVDSHGSVWVADQSNQRLQRFDLEGKYVGQFGSAGSGEGQFQFPTANSPAGIAADANGRIWVTDVNNQRIQRWQLGNYRAQAPEALDLRDGDPKVEVESSGGLVTEVVGNAAGTNTYAHSGDDLTANAGPDGESKYDYDGAGRMTKVTLANGTWGSIAYTADGRVKSVTVDPAGAAPAKATEFEYQDAPSRRTTVYPADAPHITFDIGADGSVLKWWNTAKPPTIEPLGGNLFDNRGEVRGATPMAPGVYKLDTRAYSPEGIASIQIITDGNQLAEESKCEQDPNKPGLECIEPPLVEWVMETTAFTPGIHWIEVLVTDRLGATATQRFWINVPQPPPPSIGAPTPPTFKDIKRFREDFGLEVVFPVASQVELNERIFNLMQAWNNPNSPAGQVARASWERWGVPLRPEDVAEMEYREGYLAVDIPLIEDWAQSHRTDQFAGYYVDHRAGGILHLGFTQEQAAALGEIKTLPGIAGSGRLAPFAALPSNSRGSLQSTMDSIDSLAATDSVLKPLIMGLGLDEKTNVVEVGGTNPTQIEARLNLLLDPTAPVSVIFEEAGMEFDQRNHLTGRMLGGEQIFHSTSADLVSGCTAGFGAWEQQGLKPTGEPKYATFLLTAGHCTSRGQPEWYRAEVVNRHIDTETWRRFGHAARTGFVHGGEDFETDVSAIRLNNADLMPRYIYKPGEKIKPVGQLGKPYPGETLCFSAPGSEVTHHPCGEFVGIKQRRGENAEGIAKKRLVQVIRFAGMPGDSGGPVWSPRLQRSVGIILGGPNDHSGAIIGWATPLGNPRGWEKAFSKVPGALNAPGMGSLSLAVPGE